MSIEVTEQAADVLGRSLDLMRLDRSTGGVRLRGARGLGGGLDVQVEVADGPEEGEQVIEAGSLRLFVDPSVTEVFPDAVLAVEPQHETVVVRPAE